MKTKQESAAKFIARMLKHPNPLMQAFMLEAVATYAQRLVETPLDEHVWGEFSVIAPAAWNDLALHMHTEVVKAFGG